MSFNRLKASFGNINVMLQVGIIVFTNKNKINYKISLKQNTQNYCLLSTLGHKNEQITLKVSKRI